MTRDERQSRSGRGGRERRSTWARRPRRAPFLRLLAYYAVAVGLAAILARYGPAVRDAFVAPIVLPAVQEVPELAGAPAGAALSPTPHRALTTALVIIGTLALVLPVAWVYRYTRGLRTDRSLIQSMIVLPLVVAGIVIVVKNSLALAFSLAGIVAAVRFRNTLKDPRDAVYVFLSLGLGLAAGVQALDIALVVSLAFNLIVLALWQFDVGAVASGGEGALAVGDAGLLVARGSEQRSAIRAELPRRASDMETDGVLLIHSPDPDAALEGLEAALGDAAKDWRVVGTRPNTDGIATLELLVRLKKDGDPVRLLGDLEDRWSAFIAAAEYIPVQNRNGQE